MRSRLMLTILGCLAAAACSPLKAQPRQGAVSRPVPQVQECPFNWTNTIWVNATADQVEDIKQTAQSDAVYCTRYVGNTDSERTPETGVMVEVKSADITAKLPKGEEDLTPEEANALVEKVEQLQLNAESEADAVLQRLQEVGYDAAPGSQG